MAQITLNVPDALLERLETAVQETFRLPDGAVIPPTVLVRRAARLYLMDILANYEIKRDAEAAAQARRAQIRVEIGGDELDGAEAPAGRGGRPGAVAGPPNENLPL